MAICSTMTVTTWPSSSPSWLIKWHRKLPFTKIIASPCVLVADPAGPVKRAVVMLIDMSMKWSLSPGFRPSSRMARIGMPFALACSKNSMAPVPRPQLHDRNWTAGPGWGWTSPWAVKSACQQAGNSPADLHRPVLPALSFNDWLWQKWQWSDQRFFQQLWRGWRHVEAAWFAVAATQLFWCRSSGPPSLLVS